MTVFTLSWATGFGLFKRDFINAVVFGIVFRVFHSCFCADCRSYVEKCLFMPQRPSLFLFCLFFFLEFRQSSSVTLFLCRNDGFTYGPLGTFLSELFPTNIRYSGTSLAFNMAGIIGAAFAPMIAIWLATHYSLTYVGFI
jgi:MFS family permease